MAGGYRLLCDVLNRSPVGVSDVVVDLSMDGGELQLGDTVMFCAIEFARRALAGGDQLTVTFPHVVRPSEPSFDTGHDFGQGFTISLYWRDESGQAWRRVDGGRAVRFKSRHYPNSHGHRG